MGYINKHYISVLTMLFVCFDTTLRYAQAQTPADTQSDTTPGQSSHGSKIIVAEPKRDLDLHIFGEAAFTLQNLFSFHSTYNGSSSLLSRQEAELTHNYTVFFKKRLNQNLSFYVNPELALGNSLSTGSGLGGAVNGDFLSPSSVPKAPYIARAFAKWHIWFNNAVQSAPAEIASGSHPGQVLFTGGKLAVEDIFDLNSYANNPRAQFSNVALCNNIAADYAQDSRGYTFGLVTQWVQKTWTLRLGTFAMPTMAGGYDMAYNPQHSHSDQLEFEFHPRLSRTTPSPLIVRLQEAHNVGNLGHYRDALTQQVVGTAPDITSVRGSGVGKSGFGINMEQAIADDGDTGLFFRYGWNNGVTESYALAESDRLLSFGSQISGKRWGRASDVLGIGVAQNDLSAVHSSYLAAGGQGLALGDGNLTPGPERLIETYYSRQINPQLSLSLDYQYIMHPGFNRDRGPVSMIGMRLHRVF